MRVYASAEMTLTDTNDGISVTGIDRYYMASSSSSGITVDSQGWKPDPQETNPVSRYHWSYEVVKYSDGAAIPSKPAIIGVYGRTGEEGMDAVTISLSSEAHTFAGTESRAVASSVTIDISAFKGNQRIPTSIGTITGGISGQLTHSESGRGTTNNKLVINATSSLSKGNGTLSIPIVADGRTFNKVFSWSVAFKGIPGKNGVNGTTTYTWTKYADTPTSGMENSPEGKKYIGLAFNKTTQTESSNYDDYQWSLMPQNIEVGGRNLVPNSKLIEHPIGMNSHVLLLDGLTEGTYTISFDYVVDSIGVGLDDFLIYAGSTVARVPLKLTGDKRVQQTFTINPTHVNNRLTIYFGNGSHQSMQNAGRLIELQIEKGNTATDWTPAPEDVEAAYIAVAQAKAEAERAKAEAYADGVVSDEEKARIKDADAKLAAAKKHAEDQINISEGKATSWKKTYRVNHPSPLKLTRLNGDALSPLNSYEVSAKVVGTGTVTSATSLFRAKESGGQTSNGWELVNIYSMGESSNHPEFFIDSDGDPAVRLYNHNSKYNVEVTHTEYTGSQTSYTLSENVAQAKAEAERVIAEAYADGIVSAEEKARIADANAKLAAAKKYAIDQILADKTIKDTRNDNENPNWYFSNYPRQIVREFKNISTMGLSVSGQTYGILTTDVPWTGNSGGAVKQEFKVHTQVFKRSGTSTSWTPWVNYDEIAETAKSDAATAKGIADGAASSASTANNLLADIASDSKLTPSEKKDAKKEWDIIVGEKPKIDSSANTYGVITEKTAYNTAYNTLNNYLSGLLANLNTTSNIVGATFRANFKAYYNARQDLLNKIADGAKSLVDKMEIGGRNLVVNTKGKLYRTFGSGATLSEVNSATRLTWTDTSQTSMGEKLSVPLIVGETYTLSFEARGTLASPHLELFILTTSGANLSISNSLSDRIVTQEFKKYTATFKFTGNPSDRLFIGGRGPSGKWLEVKDATVKLEKGNKATDWTPAPEDLYKYSDEVAQAKANAERIKAEAYADGVVSDEERKRITDAEDKYRKALILSRASSGKLMNSDPNFSKNLNELNVYNNAKNGNVAILYEDVSSSTGPSGVTRRLRVTTTGAAAPTWGGVVPSPNFMSRANAEYVIRFTALLPKGRSFYHAQNAMGSGYTVEWLTSAEGTGGWEEYVYYYKCGSTGTFSSFGHLYVLGGTTPTTASPLIWYLDKYEALDISNVTGNPSQEDVDGKASVGDLIDASNNLNTSIGDLSNTVDGKLDKSIYEEFLEHNANIQQQVAESMSSAEENISTALSKTATVEQTLGKGAADWIFTHTRIRMSDEGITLGEEGSGSYLQISDEQISFFNGSKEPVAFINGGMLHINHAIFVESIQISQFMFSSEISGHLTLRYVGN